MPTNNGAVLKVLFIGNSATYVNNIPQTLSLLAQKAGYRVEVGTVTKGGVTLSHHADATTDLGKSVSRAIAGGAYDIVFLQDNGRCILSEENREESFAACRTLDRMIRDSGARTFFYVRPPTGRDQEGYDAYTQCLEYDKHFCTIAEELGAENAYVNRAFAYAIKHLDIPLWGPDNAHTSPEGAYLAVCVFFATLFRASATLLDDNGLPADVALSLQQAADKVVLGQYIPQ